MKPSFANVSLVSARFHSANLTGANLSGANLSGADLRMSKLKSADLSQVTVDNKTLLLGAHITHKTRFSRDTWQAVVSLLGPINKLKAGMGRIGIVN